MKRRATIDEIFQLRKEIVLCSLYYSDYRNTLGINEKDCFAFFDGYAEYLQETMEQDGITDAEYFEHLGLYDNEENLSNWYYCFENALDCGLFVEEAEE